MLWFGRHLKDHVASTPPVPGQIKNWFSFSETEACENNNEQVLKFSHNCHLNN